MDNFTDKDMQGVYDPNRSEIEVNTPPATIPYYAHEAEVMRMEKHSRRLWVALLVAILAILASNIAWLWYINQYDFADYEYEQDGYGVNIIGNGNGVGADGTEITYEGED